ncbi:MAG: hypothetical protein IH995_05865 [Proteobacteria bacterium]|nr:hypothetical protein [Pseudomonadota bacterium]
MFKLLTQNKKIRRTIFLPAVAVFGLTLGMADFDLARAELTPDVQNQVNQILAAGGPDVIANLAALAAANLDAATDILVAGCAGGADYTGLATAISAFTDDATDAALLAIASACGGTGMGGTTGGGTTGGGTIGGGTIGGGTTGGSNTSENPNQTSGSETEG